MQQETKAQSYSVKELCALYGVTWKVWNAWIEPIREKVGEVKGRKYSPKQVKIIFDHLGPP